jgi:hypothetical protein
MRAFKVTLVLFAISAWCLPYGWAQTFSSGSSSDIKNEFEYDGTKYSQVIRKEVLFSTSTKFDPANNPSLDLKPIIENARKLASKLDSKRNWIINEISLENSDGYWFFIVRFMDQNRSQTNMQGPVRIAFCIDGQFGEFNKYEKSGLVIEEK